MPLNIAVIGAGFMGRVHAHAYYKGRLDARVRYVVATRLSRANELARSLPGEVMAVDSYQRVLDDPQVDLVDLCIPTPLHHDFTLRAAAAGKHVLCEKPIALTVAQADEMITACRECGVRLMVTHVLRFWPEYVAAASLVREGRIGPLRRITCTRFTAGHSWDAGSLAEEIGRGKGAIRDMAIHDFDYINMVAGYPSKVTAMGDAGHFVALLQLPNGVVGQVESAVTMPRGYGFLMAFRLLGEDGLIEFTGQGGSLILVTGGQRTEIPVSGSRTFNQDASSETLDGYYYEIEYFLDCLQAGREPERATPESAREALAISLEVEKAIASKESRRDVSC